MGPRESTKDSDPPSRLRRRVPGERAGHGVARAAAALLLVCAGCTEASRPNVVLILVDTLRADHLAAYGHPSVRTPNADRLAREGVLFEQAFTVVPTTLASTASIFTGQIPRTHGVPRNGFVLREQATTLAERLREEGYTTAAFVGSFALARRTGIGQGFDVYDEGFRKVGGRMIPQRRGEEVTDAAIGWLEDSPRPPYFLFVHYFDVHYPYDPLPPYDALYGVDYEGPIDGSVKSLEVLRADLRKGRDRSRETAHVKSLYLGEVSYVDEQVGRLLSAVDSRGDLDRSIVVLMSDHGEAFDEHALEYFNHGWTLYDPTIRIPLIVRLARASGGGRRVTSVVRTIDLAPTIYTWLGLPVPEHAEGISFANLVNGASEPDERTVFAEATRPHRAEPPSGWKNDPKSKCMRTARWKYVWTPHLSGKEELYDLLNDARETTDLLHGERPGPKLVALRRDLRQRLLALTRTSSGPSAEELGEDTREALEALGYVD